MFHYHEYNKFIKTTVIDALFILGSFIYCTYLTPYFLSIGFSKPEIGVLMATFGISCAIFSPILGAISDRIGRYRVIIFGITVEISSLVGYLLITDIHGMIILRIFSGIAFSAVTMTSRSRIHDIVTDNKERGKVSGIFESLISSCALVAPLVGGFISTMYGYQYLFLTSFTLLTVILFSLIIFDFKFYKDPNKKHDKIKIQDWNIIADIKCFFKIKQLRAIGIVGFAANFSAPFWSMVLPIIIIEQKGLSTMHLSIVFMMLSIPHLFQYYFGYIADKWGNSKSIIIGLIGMSLMLFVYAFIDSYILILLVTLIKAITGGIWNVAAWSYMSEIGEKHKIEGKVLGTYYSLAKVASTISFLITGIMMVLGVRTVFILYSLVVLIPTIFCIKSLKEKL